MNKNSLFKKILALISLLVLSISLVACSSFNSSHATSVTNKNAYERALDDGYAGTLDEWLIDLVSESSYDSIYQMAKSENIIDDDTSLEDFIASLKGDSGEASTKDASSLALLSSVSVYCNFTVTTSIGGFFGHQTQDSTVTSAGSGVIVEDSKEEGIAYIITNYHVVYNVDSNQKVSNNIKVFLYGMELSDYAISATYLGGSMTYDIAVLKITSDIYKDAVSRPVVIADSSKINIGDTVLAVGNPESYGISVTSGIVSIKEEVITLTSADESTEVDYRVIRMDAPVNSGNSGGGLFNDKGELVGIVNAKTVKSSVEGMGYAIPTNIAFEIYKKIKANEGLTNKTIQKVLLGITTTVSGAVVSYDEATKTTSVDQKINVYEVSKTGAAYGILKVGDEIISATYKDSTTTIDSKYRMEDILLKCSKGDLINLYILRDGSYQTVTVALSNVVNVS